LVAGGAAVLVIAAACLAPRLGDVLERSEGSGSRFDEWAVAARVIAEHPAIGVGPEGYRIAVSEGIDRHYERTYGRDRVLPDRAHSGPLDVAVAGGVPAALAFCALIGFVGRRALGLLRAAGPTAGIAAGTIAYSLQQLLLFPVAEVDPIWWLLAGIVVAAHSTTAPSLAPANRHRPVALGAVLLAPIALVAGVLDVAADRLAHRAVTDADTTSAIDSAERAVDLRPDDLRYRMVLAEILGRRSTLADIDAAIRQADLALDWSPHDPIAADVHASFLLDRANVTGDLADVRAALNAWQHLVHRDPLRARWQLQLGRAAALAGDVRSARDAWTIATDLSPDDSTASELLRELDSL
jgi:tetratricopeptide (TPR) repeat protein